MIKRKIYKPISIFIPHNHQIWLSKNQLGVNPHEKAIPVKVKCLREAIPRREKKVFG
jgi:hypothetical protein